jgi:hypothetical protein
MPSQFRTHTASRIAVLVAGLAMARGVDAAPRPAVKDFMPKAGFTAAQIASLDKGEAVVRTLKAEMVAANDTAEVAVVGVIRLDAPRQVFIDAVKDVAGFRSSGIVQVGVIQQPPQAADFVRLTIPPADVKDLKACKPGSCALKLAGPGLADLQSKIDWKGPDAGEQVNKFAREKLQEAVTAYLAQGTAAFKPLEDKSTKVSIDEQFRALLQNTPALIAFYPELSQYLLDYPKATLASSKDVLFWSHKDFGLKPTVTLTHAVGYAPPGTEDAVVAWKQLYASHYFNGGLSVTTYAKDGPASYLVQLDRVRADSLGGAFGGVKRSKMGGAMEGDLRKFLEGTKTVLQARAKK